jgi:hypothetical protein
MSEIWLNMKIPYESARSAPGSEDFGRLMIFVEEVLQRVEPERLASHHFFFESEFELRIETRIESDIEDHVKPGVRQAFLEVFERDFNEEWFDPDYAGESELYGRDGWKIAKMFFMYGSQIAIKTLLRNDTGYDIREMFETHKFVHCFLNQQGLSTVDEAKFHWDRAMERWTVAYERLIRSLSQEEGRLHPQSLVPEDQAKDA